MVIRLETDKDVDEIRHINLKAFVTEAEANLVDALRDASVPRISLVYESAGRLLGHILFTPVTLNGLDVEIAGLAPMAVLPEFQRRGVGSALVEEGLLLCFQAGYEAVVVLGYPDYYSRFGFVPASCYGLKSEYDVADDVFMAKELVEGSLSDLQGVIRYHDSFNQV